MTSGNSPLYDAAHRRVALSTVGFLTVGSEPDEFGWSLGSGTLASIGSTSGVVTAAHVLTPLREHESVGIVHFVPPEGRYQRGIVATGHCGDVALGKEPWLCIVGRAVPPNGLWLSLHRASDQGLRAQTAVDRRPALTARVDAETRFVRS